MDLDLVDNQRGLGLIADSLRAAPTLFLDTEFDSSRAGSTLCLLQLSDGGRIHLIDALRLRSLDALGPLFSDPEREWVLHAGTQDIGLLAERFGLKAPPRVFDTQVAWALSSAEHSVSLAYLRFRVLGVRSGKSHQTDDWTQRPLPKAQLAYAAADIEDLPSLHRALTARLARLGRQGLIHAASAESTWPSRDSGEALSIESFRNAWQLDVHSQAALRFLVDWLAALSPAERAAAPEPKTLLSLASRLPRTGAELGRIKGVSRRFATVFGDRLSSEMARAAASADTESFVPIDPPPYATFEEIRLDGWLSLARAELSAELEVAPELAFPSRVMKRLRQHILETGDRVGAAELLTGWRGELAAEPWRRFARRAWTSGSRPE